MGGITGHTGRAVAECIESAADFHLVAAVGQRSQGQDIGQIFHGMKDGRIVYPDVRAALEVHDADCYVDFTTPQAALRNLSDAVAGGVDVVVGTTGMDEHSLSELMERVTEDMFVMIASNYSLGIMALAQFSQRLASLFGTDDMEIIETHNITKLDKPSGTALYLQRKLSPVDPLVPIESRRIAAPISRHEIFVHLDEQTLSFKHEVTDPSTFGCGVLYVLRHCAGKTGVYRDLASFVDELGPLALSGA